ncbi:helix-turn-helix domain-containing protein [Paenibacillus harenae]|uniref:Transcriptional regulator with XRE-family HTH domain n=1 Tax=Paenibacillus harenae TaxID=306543 RepID=A0ABT9U0R9_PAEHA|nr:helix-turn-helix transcriptional regulator [Paenibacillus harenae]MDQ0112583.1 transcriptional regulator with XRE-family HTH domain [Paenibacillus harenae]
MLVDVNHFGERISQLRHGKSMTQEKLGSILNVSAQAVSKWEKGDSLPDISVNGVSERF